MVGTDIQYRPGWPGEEPHVYLSQTGAKAFIQWLLARSGREPELVIIYASTDLDSGGAT
jgi:hypothetical protein